MSKQLELDLRSGLLGTGLVQPVQYGSGKGTARTTIWALCRLVRGQERAWLELAQELLAYCEGTGVDLHLCRRFLLKDGQMVSGWHLELMAPAKTLKKAFPGFLATLQSAAPELGADAPPTYVDPPRQPAARPQEPPRPGQRMGTPIPPGPPARVDPAPPGFMPTLKVIKDEVDDNGKRTIVEEMPLPHVYREMNRPAHRDGKGARMSDGNWSPGRR